MRDYYFKEIKLEEPEELHMIITIMIVAYEGRKCRVMPVGVIQLCTLKKNGKKSLEQK